MTEQLLAMSTLAWRPFLDPAPLHGVWWLLIVPLTFGVSFAYKAIRTPHIDRVWRTTLTMFAQVLLGLLAFALGLYVFVEVIAPLYA